MNKYKRELPQMPSFMQKGLYGYNYNIENKEISITMEDCFSGHDYYHTNIYSAHIYYIVEGAGKFKINGEII